MNKFFFAQKAFIINEGRLLLLQKSLDDPNQGGKWEVPGGRIDFGEDIDPHIKREVREEVGIEIEPGSPFHIWQWQNERKTREGELMHMQVVAVARLCKPLTTVVTTAGQVQEDYIAKAEWVQYSKILTYDLIQNMIPVVKSFLKTIQPNTATG